jgi:hypothetical protein
LGAIRLSKTVDGAEKSRTAYEVVGLPYINTEVGWPHVIVSSRRLVASRLQWPFNNRRKPFLRNLACRTKIHCNTFVSKVKFRSNRLASGNVVG